MANIKQKLLNLLEIKNEDKKVIEEYLKENEVETLFKEYKDLNVNGDTKEQVESLKVILESFESM